MSISYPSSILSITKDPECSTVFFREVLQLHYRLLLLLEFVKHMCMMLKNVVFLYWLLRRKRTKCVIFRQNTHSHSHFFVAASTFTKPCKIAEPNARSVCHLKITYHKCWLHLFNKWPVLFVSENILILERSSTVMQLQNMNTHTERFQGHWGFKSCGNNCDGPKVRQ